MAEAAEKYLTELRKALRRLKVPLEEEALADAREFLDAEYAARRPSYTDIRDALGPPVAVAGAYLELSRQHERSGDPLAPRKWYRFAPGWNLTCLSCGKTVSRERYLRIGVRIAWSILCFRLYWCRECHGLRIFRLWKNSSIEARWIRRGTTTLLGFLLVVAAASGSASESRAAGDTLFVERFDAASSLKAWSPMIGATIGDGGTSRFEWDAGSLCLEADEGTQHWYALMHDVPVAGVECIRVGARMRAAGIDASRARFKNANLFLRFPDGQFRLVKYIDGTSDWVAVSRRFRIPDGVENLQVGCFLSVPGRMWIDDIEVEAVPDEWVTERHGRFEYHFHPGDEPSEKAMAFNEESLRIVSGYLETEVPDRIPYVKYRDLDMIEEYTGRRGNAHRTGTVIHSIWSTDRHELVHVLAEPWGNPTPLLGEGLAVFLSGQWQGVPVRDFARRLIETGDWIPPASLLSAQEFFRQPDMQTYAIAGVFVEWVDSAYGRETVQVLYESLPVDGTPAESRAAVERILKLNMEDIEEQVHRYVMGD